MSAKTVLALLFLISIVVVAVILLRGGPAQTAGTPSGTMILVTANAVPAGTLLRAQDVKWQSWDTAVAPDSIVRPSAESRKSQPDADDVALTDIYGAVARAPIAAGTPLNAGVVVKPGDRSFLAAVLTPGYRAVAIGVTAVSGAAGRIYPGDHVDVVLTQSFKDNEQSLAHRSVSETVVENLRVLAIDHHAQQASADEAQPRTVTLEVLPKQAEMIDVANELGKLSLTLRSPDASDQAADAAKGSGASKATWAEDVSPALRESRAGSSPRGSIRIMRGSKIEDAKQE